MKQKVQRGAKPAPRLVGGLGHPGHDAIFHNPEATANLLRVLCPLRPTLAMVLGSGFHPVVSDFKIITEIPFDELPGFPPTGVTGHEGTLLCGRLGATPVMILSGRAHYYEGHSMDEITFPIRVMAAFGIHDILLTNAAGGINRSFKPGSFMALLDHINLMGANPLRGETPPGLERFVDLTQVYSPELTALLMQAAKECGLKLHKGVYLAVSGPSYETPAEIRAFARMGADAVGMSTIPEAIVARQCGLRVAAVSCITNPAAGTGSSNVSHAKVLETAEKVRVWGALLLKHFARLHHAA
jgi:purine-nucleoside phosphorylase